MKPLSVEDGTAKKKLSPYQRIIRAAKKGNGIRLNYAEVHLMSIDTTILDLAENDDTEDK